MNKTLKSDRTSSMKLLKFIFLMNIINTTNKIMISKPAIMRQVLSLITFLSFLLSIESYSLSSRREIFSAAATVFGISPAANAILSSKECVSGVGDGCVDLSGDNDLIKSLQAKSAANKEQYVRVSYCYWLVVHARNNLVRLSQFFLLIYTN